MQKIWMAAFAAAMAIGLATSPAYALVDHAWVASNGNNAFVCDRPNPCADFATAISKTNAGGEISCVDSADYGPLTINKAITIDCTGAHASVAVSGGAATGIPVTVPGGTKVVLRGLDIQGLSAETGIRLTQGGSLHVEQCIVRGFVDGIVIFATNATELYVIDTSLIYNGNTGIAIQPSGGPVVKAVLDRVRVHKNANWGVGLFASSGATTRLEITNSTVSDNGADGLIVNTGAQPATVVAANTVISGNGTGVFSNGAAAAIILNGNTITNNGTAMSTQSGGAIFSYGNNAVNDNGSPGTAPTPVALR